MDTQDKCKAIAVMNQKGGVGKTTTALALGAECARSGRRTLLVDADMQANLTACLERDRTDGTWQEDGPRDLGWLVQGMADEEAGRGTAHDPADAVRSWEPPASLRRSNPFTIDYIPAGPMFGRARNVLRGMDDVGHVSVLTRILAPLRGEYDAIVIDSGPQADEVSANCVLAADSVIVPSQAASFAVQGIDALLRTIAGARLLHPGLTLAGILITMYQPHTKAQHDMADALRGTGAPILDTTVPRGVAADAASLHGVPVTVGPTMHTPVGMAYRDLAAELRAKEAI